MFNIGDKVLCVDDHCNEAYIKKPNKWIHVGFIYTIRHLENRDNALGVRLEEIILPINPYLYEECLLLAKRFRKIDYDKNKINTCKKTKVKV